MEFGRTGSAESDDHYSKFQKIQSFLHERTLSNFLDLETFIARLGRNLVQREKFSQPGNRQMARWVMVKVLPPKGCKTSLKTCLRTLAKYRRAGNIVTVVRNSSREIG